MKASIDSEFLYHFTTKEILIEHILPTLNLKLNFLKNTNDPKEKLMSTKFAINKVKFPGEYLELYDRFQKMIDDEYRIACFSSDYMFNSKRYSGFQLVRMWATYGDNHKGVCLVIDKQKFADENLKDSKTTHLQKVDYYAEPSNKISKVSNNQIADIELDRIADFSYNRIFFTKHHDWRTENEIRFLSKGNEGYCSIKKSFVKIILGMDFDSRYVPAITNQIKKDFFIEVEKVNFNHLTGDLEL